MRKLTSCALFPAAVLLGLLAGVERSQGEPIGIWSDDAGRALRPGPYVPYDGAPYTYRYTNASEGAILLGTWPGFYYLNELDRQERLAKFGTRYGPNHPPIFNRLLDRLRR
jgi:hypothetical protein